MNETSKSCEPELKSSVNKMGGEAMENLEMDEAVIRVAKENRENIFLVVSAFKGVTKQLYKAMDKLSGKQYKADTIKTAIDEAFEPVKEIHKKIIEKYFQESEGDDQNYMKEAWAIYEKLFEEIRAKIIEKAENYFINLAVSQDTYKIRDQVIGLGENISKNLLQLYLKKKGLESVVLNFKCDQDKLNGDGSDDVTVVHESIRSGMDKEMESKIEQVRGEIIKISGGHDEDTPNGMTIDIGRGYTDTNAVDEAIVVRNKLGSVMVRFWKFVSGILTMNPDDAAHTNMPELHEDVWIKEAREAAMAGSGLIQADALNLAMEHELELIVQNIQKPKSEKVTHITKDKIETHYPFKTIVSTDRVDSLKIALPAMATGPGFGAAIVNLFVKYGLPFDNVFNTGGSLTFTFNLPGDESDKIEMRDKIRRMKEELNTLTVNGRDYKTEELKWEKDIAFITLVGVEMSHEVGLKTIALLAQAGIKPLHYQYSDGDIRFTIAVKGPHAKRAQQLIHEEFFDKPRAAA